MSHLSSESAKRYSQSRSSLIQRSESKCDYHGGEYYKETQDTTRRPTGTGKLWPCMSNSSWLLFTIEFTSALFRSAIVSSKHIREAVVGGLSPRWRDCIKKSEFSLQSVDQSAHWPGPLVGRPASRLSALSSRANTTEPED